MSTNQVIDQQIDMANRVVEYLNETVFDVPYIYDAFTLLDALGSHNLALCPTNSGVTGEAIYRFLGGDANDA